MSGTYAPFPINPALVAIAVAYTNRHLIADSVLPRVPVAAQVFEYDSYPKGTFFQLMETEVSRKGKPNQVEVDSTKVPSATVDQALDAGVPNVDIQNYEAQVAAGNTMLKDPLLKAGHLVRELVALRREVRVAQMVFSQSQYAASNRTQLAGNAQWSVNHADSQPITVINTAKDAMIMPATTMILGHEVSTKLRTHRSIVKAYNGSLGDEGMVPIKFLEDLFELEVLVGASRFNTAKKGQPVNLQRAWGKHVSLIHKNTSADTEYGTTFGYTAQWGGPIGGNFFNKDIGARGGQEVRIGESVKEIIAANDLGYFIEDAIA